jgi:four helix bundle protein
LWNGGKDPFVRDHRKLKAFLAADALVESVYRETKAFPRSEAFGLTAQMRRAAVSAVANIVEGSARESEAEYRQFLCIAFGSLREVGYFIDLAHRLDFLTETGALHLVRLHEEASRLLGGLVRRYTMTSKR